MRYDSRTLRKDIPVANSHDELSNLLDCRHTAVLVVDVQKRFTQRRRAPMFPALKQVLPRLQWFIKQAHDAGVLVVRIRAIQFDDTNGALDFHPGFEPRPGDLLVMKRQYSAFFGTTLESILRDRHIGTVVLAGLKTNVCVGSTARDAFQRGFNVITLGDCTAANSQIGHEGEIHTLAEYFGMVCSSSDVAHCWSNGHIE